jgi:hypothetical protein
MAERETWMRNGKRGRYTLEFKQEAVRVAESSPSLAEAAPRWGGRADLVELGQGASRGEVERGQGYGGRHGEADGDQSFAGRTGAGDHGARNKGAFHFWPFPYSLR